MMKKALAILFAASLAATLFTARVFAGTTGLIGGGGDTQVNFSTEDKFTPKTTHTTYDFSNGKKVVLNFSSSKISKVTIFGVEVDRRSSDTFETKTTPKFRVTGSGGGMFTVTCLTESDTLRTTKEIEVSVAERLVRTATKMDGVASERAAAHVEDVSSLVAGDAPTNQVVNQVQVNYYDRETVYARMVYGKGSAAEVASALDKKDASSEKAGSEAEVASGAEEAGTESGTVSGEAVSSGQETAAESAAEQTDTDSEESAFPWWIVAVIVAAIILAGGAVIVIALTRHPKEK